jgi:hypothetical protein
MASRSRSVIATRSRTHSSPPAPGKFLITIDKQVPTELDVHLIWDSYGTHN